MEIERTHHTSLATKHTKSHMIMFSITKIIFTCDNSTIAFNIILILLQVITLQQLHHTHKVSLKIKHSLNCVSFCFNC